MKAMLQATEILVIRDKEISKIEHLVAEMEQKVWVPGKVANSELAVVFHILFHFSVRPAGK